MSNADKVQHVLGKLSDRDRERFLTYLSTNNPNDLENVRGALEDAIESVGLEMTVEEFLSLDHKESVR